MEKFLEDEEEKKKRKKKKQEEIFLLEKTRKDGVLKSVAKVVAKPIKLAGMIFGSDPFIVAFLDASKIKEKDNYHKQTAKNTREILENMKIMNKNLDRLK